MLNKKMAIILAGISSFSLMFGSMGVLAESAETAETAAEETAEEASAETAEEEVSMESILLDLIEQGNLYGKDPVSLTITEYFKENNIFDPSDVTLVTASVADVEFSDDLSKVTYFGDFEQSNFNKEGEKLVYVSGGVFTGIMTFESKDGGETYEVTSAEFAGDGEQYSKDVEAFCEKTGLKPDYFYAAVEEKDILLLQSFITYVHDDPSISVLVQSGGEEITYDEAVQKVIDYYNELTEVPDEGGEAAEESAEEAAE